MAKVKILKIAGIFSEILALAWAALSVKAGFRPFRTVRVAGWADGPTSTYVAMCPRGRMSQVMFWAAGTVPVILAASIACFLMKILAKEKGHE